MVAFIYGVAAFVRNIKSRFRKQIDKLTKDQNKEGILDDL